VNDLYVMTAIVAMAVVTFLIRALPFMGARWLRGSPVVRGIGVFLPPAIMALLLVHSARDLGEQAPGQWLPAVVAVLVVLTLQLYQRQPLLSIAAGTVLYMSWIQVM
jgi:branched-subunit amino acid transport protein AzlD